MTNDHLKPTDRTPFALAALWTFILLNILVRDLHEFFRPGLLEQIISGTVNGVKITDTMMVIGAIMMEIPLFMIIAPFILKAPVNRLLNILVGLFAAVLLVVNNRMPDLDDWIFLTVESITLGAIIWLAFKWQTNSAIAKAATHEHR